VPLDPRANRLLLVAIVGSRAYGLDRAGSDVDRRGVYLAMPDAVWSLKPPAEQLTDETNDEVYWELGKFIRLALAANPTVLETLFSPIIEHATPLGRRLIEQRRIFLSRKAADTFGGYARQQLAKYGRRLDRDGGEKPKLLMHCLRLLHAGRSLIETGSLPLDAGDRREHLLSIRDGRVPLDEVLTEADDLLAQLQAALPDSPLPAEPDVAAADALLIAARRSALEQELP
jgi:predicted nucleotidyltransferase